MVDELQAMVAPDEARALLLRQLRALPAEPVAVGDGLAGRVLAEPARATGDLPPFANSAMDGYALRAADAPGPLPVSGRIAAGDDPPPLEPGTCMAIATGAAMPDGADAVVPLERAVEEDGAVRATASVAAGANVRTVGEDVAAGELVLEAGRRLTPLAAAGLAAAGLGEVRCHRRPRVAVLVTGDELVPPGRPLRRGQIHESNSVMIAGRCRELGADVVLVEQVADTHEATHGALSRALERADVVLTSGGVSVGPHDHVKPALEALGVERLFWRISTQPGKPTWAGVRGRQLAVGLPGNPLSVLVGLELLVRPALDALAGVHEPGPPPRRAELAGPLRRNPLRTRFVPVRLQGGRAELLGAGLSHLVARAAAADALAVVPPGEGELPAGSDVEVLAF